MEVQVLEVPLFPLNVVLFPTMTLPLHIFEERYKLMIGQCLDGDKPFGVVLIKSGKEVGLPAEPHDVGTLARITQVEKLADGRMNITVVGERRFRIIEITQKLPYVAGKVELMEAIADPLKKLVSLANRVTALFYRYMELLLSSLPRKFLLPADPQHLAFLVGHTLHIPLKEKQKLLEIPSTQELLKAEVALLQREVERMQKEKLMEHFLQQVAPQYALPPEKAIWN